MPAIARPWTRQEVLDLIEQNPLATPRFELVDGELLVTPSPSDAHQFAVGRIYVLLQTYLDMQQGVGEALFSPSDAELEIGTLVQPDVYVMPVTERRRMAGHWPMRRLILAVEVVSPSSRRGDRGRKRELYQRTVPEYWIVDHSARHIEIWRPDDLEPRIERERLEWQPVGAATPLVIDVPAYFARIHGETP